MLEQDRSLENHVPRFGLLSTTRITPIVLMGVWMIFLPATIVAAIATVSIWRNSKDLITSLFAATLLLFAIAIGIGILFQSTRRYVQRNSR